MSSETALPQAVQELIERLRYRAMLEQHNGLFPAEDVADCITWGELGEISSLLKEAADALEGRAQVPAPDTAASTMHQYCAICYHALDRCSHCDALPAPPSTGASTPQEK